MAGEAYVYQQIDLPDYGQKFNDLVAEAKKKKEEKDKLLVDTAKRIKPPTVTMYGSHKRMLTDWAEHLNKNLDEFASSPEGQVKFERQLGMYNQFMSDAETYYGNTYGSEEDDMMKNTFMSTTKANADKGALEKDGVRDLNEFDHYVNNLKYLDRDLYSDGSLDFDENGVPVFSTADGEKTSLSEYQFDDTVFMRDFQREKAKSGYDLYNDKGSKIPHKDRDAAENWTKNKLQTDPDMAQTAVRRWAEENDVPLEDAMNDPEMINQAYEEFINDSGQAWDDRNDPDKNKAAKVDERTTAQKNIASGRADKRNILQTGSISTERDVVSTPDYEPLSKDFSGDVFSEGVTIRRFPLQQVLDEDIYLEGGTKARLTSLSMRDDGKMSITYFDTVTEEEVTKEIDPLGNDANTIDMALKNETGVGITYLSGEKIIPYLRGSGSLPSERENTGGSFSGF